MSKTAHILAIRAASIAGWAGLGFGIRALNPVDTASFFANAEVWTGPRPELEDMPEYVHPIPYIVVRDGDRIMSYIRSPKSGETRLHAKRAVGLGGHVDLEDAILTDDHGIDLGAVVREQAFQNISEVVDLRGTLERAALREISEELGITLPEDILSRHSGLLSFTHIIQSQATEVDRVHIGFVVTLDLALLPSEEFAFEDALEQVTMQTPAELRAEHDRSGEDRVELETWAELIVDAMLAGDLKEAA